ERGGRGRRVLRPERRLPQPRTGVRGLVRRRHRLRARRVAARRTGEARTRPLLGGRGRTGRPRPRPEPRIAAGRRARQGRRGDREPLGARRARPRPRHPRADPRGEGRDPAGRRAAGERRGRVRRDRVRQGARGRVRRRRREPVVPARGRARPVSGPMGVGFIGVGMISDTYLENLSSFPDVRVVILGDIDTDRAKAQADKYDIPSHGTADDVLAHPDVQIVVNLTVPAVHAEISSRGIAAGKHVWTEKPIGLDRDSTSALLRQAEQAGLRVGVAPDTVLGPGVQTAKRAIEDGVIGTPLFASTSMQWQGPDLIHPNPAFLFAQGAGPLLDMGPYYFTALVNIFGPVRAVAALGLKGREERTVQAGPDAGATFPVEVPSTMQVLTAFRVGQQAQSLLSFDSPLFRHGVVEISGTDGTLVLPDPN